MQHQAPDIHRSLAMAHLPSVPQVLVQLLEYCDQEDAGTAGLGDLVNKDTGVAAKVVGIANSAYYRRSRVLEGVDQCVNMLGMDAVRSIVLNHSIIELFSRFRGVGDFDLSHFWRHTLHCAVMSRRLADRMNYPNPQEAYLAGLLHDVGRLALISVAPERYVPIFSAHGDEDELLRREQEAFGLNHAEVGAWLAERWQLHPFLVDAILYHHEPAARVESAHALVRIVRLSNALSASLEDPGRLTDALAAEAGMSRDEAVALMTGAGQDVRAIAEQFGIALPDASGPAANNGHARLAEVLSDRLVVGNAFPGAGCEMTPEEAHLALAQGTRTLFGPCAVALFIPANGMLQGQGLDAVGNRIEEIRIAVDNTDSMVARAYHGEIAALAENAPSRSVVDEQLRRLLGRNALLVLPLRHDRTRLGAMALGIDREAAEALGGRLRLLSAFAVEAGRFLLQAREEQARLEQARTRSVEGYLDQARRIVHEASNPLSVVRNYLALLKEQLQDQEREGPDIALLEEELRRVGRILDGLKRPLPQAAAERRVEDIEELRRVGRILDGLKRPAPLVGAGAERRVEDINALLGDVARVCRTGKTGPLGIELVLSQEAGLPPVRGEADKVRQVVMNLIFNAAEVLEAGGRITVASSLWRGARGERFVEISIADTGPGIPAEVMECLDQPLQSTKGGGHAGLGLSIVRNLVEELGGSMHCKSGPGGTTFMILLPAAA